MKSYRKSAGYSSILPPFSQNIGAHLQGEVFGAKISLLDAVLEGLHA